VVDRVDRLILTTAAFACSLHPSQSQPSEHKSTSLFGPPYISAYHPS